MWAKGNPAIIQQMATDFTTWQETFGNGRRIGIARIITRALRSPEE
jgi:hypothetical protein